MFIWGTVVNEGELKLPSSLFTRSESWGVSRGLPLPHTAISTNPGNDPQSPEELSHFLACLSEANPLGRGGGGAGEGATRGGSSSRGDARGADLVLSSKSSPCGACDGEWGRGLRVKRSSLFKKGRGED